MSIIIESINYALHLLPMEFRLQELITTYRLSVGAIFITVRRLRYTITLLE